MISGFETFLTVIGGFTVLSFSIVFLFLIIGLIVRTIVGWIDGARRLYNMGYDHGKEGRVNRFTELFGK